MLTEALPPPAVSDGSRRLLFGPYMDQKAEAYYPYGHVFVEEPRNGRRAEKGLAMGRG